MLGVIAVACVGNGTVRVVRSEERRVGKEASSVLPRTQFTTSRPKPRCAKPLPVIVNAAGGSARSTTLGLIPLTIGTGRVSVTVSVALPIRLKVGVLDVCCHTCACTGPAESPGMFGVIAVACVGNGTVRVVFPMRAVLRACAIKVPFRTKFTTGRPKPRFAKPLPVIVKVAGGLARSTELGTMALTPAPIAVTAAVTSPPLEVKVTFAEKTPGAVGLNRTTTDCVEFGPRWKELPETTLNGEVVEALPERIPPPVF